MTSESSSITQQSPVDTKPTSPPPPFPDDDDHEDVIIPLLLEIPDLHPSFNRRRIFPLTLSPTFDWFFNDLPAYFKKRYESCDPDDSEALESFFWDSARMIYNHPASRIEFYYVTFQASVFDSFVKEMESYRSWIRNGAFVLPMTRICNLMDWAFKYDSETDPPSSSYSYSSSSSDVVDKKGKIFPYHRHLIVVAGHGQHFLNHCFRKINQVYFAMGCISLTSMLKFKAFNSVPITRLSDLFKVCSVQQLYDDDDESRDIDAMDEDVYIEKRFNMPPVHRVDSF